MVITNFLCQKALSETGRAAEICHSSYFEIRLIKPERKKRKTHFLNFHIKKKKEKKQKSWKELTAGRGKAEPAPEFKVPKPKLPPSCLPAAMSGAELPSSFSNISILLTISLQHSPSRASTR